MEPVNEFVTHALQLRLVWGVVVAFAAFAVGRGLADFGSALVAYLKVRFSVDIGRGRWVGLATPTGPLPAYIEDVGISVTRLRTERDEIVLEPTRDIANGRVIFLNRPMVDLKEE